MRTVQPGSLFFGETASGRRSTAGAIAEAAADSVILRISRSALERTIATVPIVAARILDQMARRELEVGERLRELAYKSARGRIAATLLRLCHVDGTPLRVSHQQIAEMVGTSRETATRLLDVMRVEGLIECRPLEIMIRSRPFLEEVARDDRSAESRGHPTARSVARRPSALPAAAI